MTARMLWWTLAIVAGIAAQAWAGWWALALVGFAFGVLARSQPRAPLQYGVAIGLAGAAVLGWLAWTGRPVGEIRQILADLTSLPVLTLSLVLPALLAFCAAFLGAALGRRVLFS